MKKFLFALCIACSLCACSKYSYESVKGDVTGTRIYTLDNGLKIYTIVNKDMPRIDAQIAVKVGSKNDPRETTGLAHYFEHLMFKGTEQFGTQNYEQEKPMLDRIEELFEIYRSTEDPAERKAIYHQIDSISYEASKISIPNEYDKLMASIGADGTNAYTSQDVTCYVENIPSNQIELWAKIQADRFENCVLRGFHTELETIYEEFNMYNAQDQTKELNAMFEGLFKNHPYNTDVIGLPSHLKNPSITNVKNYHDEWYVPNNMAVVLSGDFDPDKAVAIIDKYFGSMKPNENLGKSEFAPEEPITAPVMKEVVGNESEDMILAWRFPGANSEQSVILKAFAKVMQNGKAGLIDLDINQKQKTLGMYSGVYDLADYNIFLLSSEPKPGQSLDEVKEIALAEIQKIKDGDFDESILTSTISNMKLDYMQMIENTRYMASVAVNSFVCDIPWSEVVGEIDKISAISKDDIVKFANDNFGDNYVYVKKLQGTADDGSKIDKPAITPIFTNRDTASVFLREIQAAASEVKPIEPKFVDFSKDMEKLQAKSGIEVLYKQNVTNGTFDITYLFETGSYADKVLPFACDYFNYLGTSTMSSEDIQKYLYSLACDISISCSGEKTYVSISGLAENMEAAMEFAETYFADVQPNPEALEDLKANTLQERLNAKTNQRSNASRLRAYGQYGPQNPYTNILSEEQLKALTDAELIDKLHNIFKSEHKVLCYSPLKSGKFVAKFNEVHSCPDTLEPVVKGDPFKYSLIAQNSILTAPYDANQSILYSVSSRGEQFDIEKSPLIELYNEYFGRGMNGIVFQEMREARGLAYSAAAQYVEPSDLDHTVLYMNYIQTQNDKLVDALTAFEDIINNSMGDMHPPLYYLGLAGFCNIFGHTAFTYRFFSMIPMILMLLISATVVYHQFGKYVSLIMMIFITLLDSAMNYTTEVRMYEMALLFTFIAYLSFYCIIRYGRKIDLIIFVIATILASLTYYYCILTIGILFLMLLMNVENKQTLKKYIVVGVVAMMGLIVCIVPLIRTIQRGTHQFWVERPESIIEMIEYLFHSWAGPLFGLLFLALIIVFIIGLKDKFVNKKIITAFRQCDSNTKLIISGLLAIFGTYLIVLIVSIVFVPLCLPKHLYFMSAIAWLVMAILMITINFKQWKKVVVPVFVVGIVIMSCSFCNCIIDERNSWESTQRILSNTTEIDGDDIVISDHEHYCGYFGSLIPYYYPESHQYRTDDLTMPKIESSYNYWIFTNHTIDEKVQNQLLEQGYYAEKYMEGRFADDFYTYIYKILPLENIM